MRNRNKERITDLRQEYDVLHKKGGFADEKESYEAVAVLLKGKRALDIGCGSGFLEQLAPEDIVGVDFSYQALQIAKEQGAKYLCQSLAEALPFKAGSFDISASFGVLEHLIGQYKAVNEMARVSRLQVFIVHAKLPYGLEIIRPAICRLFGLKDQPIERPLSMKELKKMVNSCGLKVIFEGMWNYIDLRWINKRLPYGLIKWPSHHLLVTIKSDNLTRKFTGPNDA